MLLITHGISESTSFQSWWCLHLLIGRGLFTPRYVSLDDGLLTHFSSPLHAKIPAVQTSYQISKSTSIASWSSLWAPPPVPGKAPSLAQGLTDLTNAHGVGVRGDGSRTPLFQPTVLKISALSIQNWLLGSHLESPEQSQLWIPNLVQELLT